MAAVAAGVRHVQATINGYGERAGNANMVSILANLALKTAARARARRRRRPGRPDRAVARRVAEIANISPERLPAVRRPVGVRPQGRRPRRGRRQGRAELPAHRPDRRRQRGPARRVASSAAGPTPRSGPSSSATSSRASSTRACCRRSIKQLEAEGLAFEGAEARFELLIRRHQADYVAAVPDRRLHLPRRAARRPRAAGRGDRQGRGRRRGPPHRGRRQRPGQRPRRGAAQGAPGVLPGARRRPPRRLQGAHPRRRRGDRRADPGDHRFVRRRRATWSTMGSDTNIIAASAAALADSLEYAIWKSGAELRRRDERHFTTASAARRRRRRPRPGGDR